MRGNMADFQDGDVVRLGASFILDTTDAVVNVFHVLIESGGPLAFAASAQDFQDYVHFLYNPLQGYYVPEFLSDRISVKNETQDTVWGSIAFKTPLAGTNVNELTASQVALLGFARTPISRVQIRKYWGPFTEGDMTDGLWLSGIRADLQDTMDYHIASHVMPNGLELLGVAYSKALDRATAAYSATTTANPVVQRRRRRGTGG